MTDPLSSERDALLSTDSSVRRFLRTLGPGLVTGAADDDPSGIGTHSQIGAQFGYGLAWTFVLSLPLMVAIQQIAAEIGRVTRSEEHTSELQSLMRISYAVFCL